MNSHTHQYLRCSADIDVWMVGRSRSLSRCFSRSYDGAAKCDCSGELAVTGVVGEWTDGETRLANCDIIMGSRRGKVLDAWLPPCIPWDVTGMGGGME